jgi:hypothetical protein
MYAGGIYAARLKAALARLLPPGRRRHTAERQVCRCPEGRMRGLGVRLLDRRHPWRLDIIAGWKPAVRTCSSPLALMGLGAVAGSPVLCQRLHRHACRCQRAMVRQEMLHRNVLKDRVIGADDKPRKARRCRQALFHQPG